MKYRAFLMPGTTGYAISLAFNALTNKPGRNRYGAAKNGGPLMASVRGMEHAAEQAASAVRRRIDSGRR
jgi:hypothetical protein